MWPDTPADAFAAVDALIRLVAAERALSLMRQRGSPPLPAGCGFSLARSFRFRRMSR
jgi:hypothetical protein